MGPVIAILSTVLLLGSCSFDYESARMAEELSEDVPDSVFEDFSHTVVRDNVKVLKIHAASSETYRGKNQIILTDVYFKEFSDDGEFLSEGWAEKAVFFTDTENAEIPGPFDIYSFQEETRIEGQGITWQQEKRILQSGPEQFITLKRKEKEELSGKGFTADLKNLTIEFAEDVQGVFRDED